MNINHIGKAQGAVTYRERPLEIAIPARKVNGFLLLCRDRLTIALRARSRLADWQSATQQVSNLRYTRTRHAAKGPDQNLSTKQVFTAIVFGGGLAYIPAYICYFLKKISQ
ncbi:MAG TPA: hypothetical protein VGI88_11485 [Verrucomicrobiae bacterium]